MLERTRPSGEGIIYGEVAAAVTIVGIIIAFVGLVASLHFGGNLINYKAALQQLLSGKGEGEIWRTCSTFHRMPPQYWYFRTRISPDEVSMLGIGIACFGSIVGLLAMIFSMIRKKSILLYKGGLYCFLAAAITAVLILAAIGVVQVRP